MASSTWPLKPPMHRSVTACSYSESRPGSRSCSGSSSVAASTTHSPFDTPLHSPSTASLSSLSSADGFDVKTRTLVTTASSTGKLFDTYGNEFELPDFSIKDIRDAIPKHCFKRSAVRGFYYVGRDIACLVATFWLFHTWVRPEHISSAALRALFWCVYAFVQGLFGTGLWVMAHECGHQAFSSSKLLNDTVGWIAHSAILVPYFSWKISHGKHHKATGNLSRDMVFQPKTRREYASRLGRSVHELSELMEETPIVTAMNLLMQQLGGWPMYLITNVTGHNNHERQPEGRGIGKHNGFGGGVNHFDPRSPLFEAKDAKLIVLSDIGLAIALTVLCVVGRSYGWWNLACWYFFPYLWVNHWLVAITYLQHTDPSLPHYTNAVWTFTRGAAATIDRDFGFIGRVLFHEIIETHVLHHYVSQIPFYHASEASVAIRPVMGKHYRSDTQGGAFGFLAALWRSTRMCEWVEPSAGAVGESRGVLFFRNRNGLGTKPEKLDMQPTCK